MIAYEEKTPQDCFNDLAEKLAGEPGRTAGLTATYQYVILGERGGMWYVDIADGRAKVREGRAERPGCTITMTDSDYVAVSTGRLSGRDAFMSGRLRVQGDSALAIRASAIFG